MSEGGTNKIHGMTENSIVEGLSKINITNNTYMGKEGDLHGKLTNSWQTKHHAYREKRTLTEELRREENDVKDIRNFLKKKIQENLNRISHLENDVKGQKLATKAMEDNMATALNDIERNHAQTTSELRSQIREAEQALNDANELKLLRDERESRLGELRETLESRRLAHDKQLTDLDRAFSFERRRGVREKLKRDFARAINETATTRRPSTTTTEMATGGGGVEALPSASPRHRGQLALPYSAPDSSIVAPFQRRARQMEKNLRLDLSERLSNETRLACEAMRLNRRVERRAMETKRDVEIDSDLASVAKKQRDSCKRLVERLQRRLDSLGGMISEEDICVGHGDGLEGGSEGVQAASAYCEDEINRSSIGLDKRYKMVEDRLIRAEKAFMSSIVDLQREMRIEKSVEALLSSCLGDFENKQGRLNLNCKKGPSRELLHPSLIELILPKHGHEEIQEDGDGVITLTNSQIWSLIRVFLGAVHSYWKRVNDDLYCDINGGKEHDNKMR